MDKLRVTPGLVLYIFVCSTLFCFIGCGTVGSKLKQADSGVQKIIPVILDTDIGGDIDDTWALALILKCPELDVKLIVTDHGNTTYRAKVAAKLLEVAGRTDIPVGIGIHENDGVGRQGPWVEDYDLSGYPGEIYEDGVGALIDTIMSSEEKITLICIGPVPNIAEALRREPKITEKARFVGMQGHIRRAYFKGVGSESNVRANVTACRGAFKAAWDVTISPIDTCGIIWLEGEQYAAVYNSEDPVLEALIENYRLWSGDSEMMKTRSSILWDTVAIYLAFSEELLVMEKLGIEVTDNGQTLINKNARIINCATKWKNLQGFRNFLTRRLTGKI